MDPFEKRFRQLARLARTAPETDISADPAPGLVTRVLTQVRAEPHDKLADWEFWTLRAVPLAAAVAVACAFFTGRPSPSSSEERALAESLVNQELAP